jgi:hypothetical protein
MDGFKNAPLIGTVLDSALATTITAAIITLGPAVLGLGIGLGGALGGAVAAGLTNAKAKKDIENAGTDLEKTLKKASQPVANVLPEIITGVEKFAQGEESPLKQLFSDSIPVLKDFVATGEQAAKQMLPALDATIKELVSSGAMTTMDQGLLTLVTGVDDFIREIGPALAPSADIFRATMNVISLVLQDTGGLMNGIDGSFEHFGHLVSDAAKGAENLADKVDSGNSKWSELSGFLVNVGKYSLGFADAQHKVATQVSAGSQKINANALALSLQDRSLVAVSNAQETNAEKTAQANAEIAEQKAQVTSLTGAINNLINPILSLEGDQVAWKSAQLAANTAIKSVTGSLDANNSAALQARQAIISSTQSAIQFAQQEITVHHNAAAASSVIKAQIAWLKQHAGNSRLAAQEINALSAALRNIPKNIQSTVSVREVVSGNPLSPGAPILGELPHKMATGGIITEPIVGVGLHSHETYEFGESGNEAVVPLNGRGIQRNYSTGSSGAGGNVFVTVQGDTNPDAAALRIWQILRDFRRHNGNMNLGLG